MSTLVVASSEQDAAAVEAVRQHHAEMAGTLDALTGSLLSAVGHEVSGHEASAAARDELVHWCVTDLLPHTQAEEKSLYPLAHNDARAKLLVDAMLVEHDLIASLVERITSAAGPIEAAAEGQALRVVFHSHLAKENDQILPLLAQAPGVSLAGALQGMHELLGGPEATGEPEAPQAPEGLSSTRAHEHGAHPSGGGGECACGETDGPALPELDARSVPHAIRHATVFGALDAVRPGGGMVLVAPHDPLPLLNQLEARSPGTFAIDYLARGPEAWRLRFVRI